jgi:hypothetical protein
MWQAMAYYLWVQNEIYKDMASSGAHHFTYEFHVIWCDKQANAQYLEYHIKSPFWCKFETHVWHFRIACNFQLA